MRAGFGRRRVVVLSVILIVLIAGGLAAGLYWKNSSSQAGSGNPSSPKGKRSTPASLKSGSPGGSKAPVPVSVAAIAVGPVSSYISSTANLVPEDEVKVLSEVEGRVAEVPVEEGDRAEKGQVLASLVRDDAEIAFKKAEVQEANARMVYERAQKMVSENLMSREEFERISTEKEVAGQELAEAKWRLDRTTFRAPFAGRVTERNVRAGQHVRPGDALFSVADFDPLIGRIYLPEKDVFGLKEGRGVRITLKANETTRFTGRIRQISPVVDPATGTVKVTVEAIAPPPEVRPGAFVTIEIVRETHPRAVLVPREAVIRELQDAYVFVARKDKAEKRSIALGLEEGDQIEALSGIAAGEQVIVAGQGGLKDGSPVKIIPSSKASSAAADEARPTRG